MVDPIMQLVPSVLRPVAKQLGYETVLRIAKAIGGRTVYIPKTRSEGTRLAGKIGNDAAAMLVAQHGGLHLVVPRANRLLAAIRGAAIQADTRNADQVANDLGLTGRRVRYIRTEGRRYRIPPALLDTARRLWPRLIPGAEEVRP